MEVDSDIGVVADCRAQFGELFGGVLDGGRGLDVAGGTLLCHSRFEGGEALCHGEFHGFRGIGVGVDPNLVAGTASEKFVHRNAERLALNVPKGLVDAAQGRGQNRTSAIEGVPVDGLPVVHHPAWVLADEIGFNFFHGLGAGLCPAFGDGFSQADNARVGVNLQEQPTGLDEEGLQLCDLDVVFG